MVLDRPEPSRRSLGVDIDDKDVQSSGRQSSGDIDRVVVLPTPPFWLETVRPGSSPASGKFRPINRSRRLFSCASSRAMGLESSIESITFGTEPAILTSEFRQSASTIAGGFRSESRPVTAAANNHIWSMGPPGTQTGASRCVARLRYRNHCRTSLILDLPAFTLPVPTLTSLIFPPRLQGPPGGARTIEAYLATRILTTVVGFLQESSPTTTTDVCYATAQLPDDLG